MKRIVKLQDRVIVVSYNKSNRMIVRYEYNQSFPLRVFARVGYAEKPLDMHNQTDKDFLSDVDYYTSFSNEHSSELKRPIFFGKNGKKLVSYYEL